MTVTLPKIDFAHYRRDIDAASFYRIKGKVTELTGLIVKAVVPGVKVGELCYIDSPHRKHKIKAEVVGFRDKDVLLMPLGELSGIGPGNDVIPTGDMLKVPVCHELLGRILDGLGDPMDEDTAGPLRVKAYYPVMASPPDPLKRRRIQ